jgi:hypothetical protein
MDASDLRVRPIADAADVSTRHLYMLRSGGSEPTLGVMVRIAHACSASLNRTVRVTELFDLGEDDHEA